MDIRVRNTMAAVRKALIDLMANESFEDISISKLCAAAEISRKTFYMHYSSLDDVVKDIGKNFYEQIFNNFHQKDRNYTMRDLLIDINSIVVKNLDFYYKMATSKSHHEFHLALEIAFQKIVADVLRINYGLTSENLDYYSSFYASGIISVYGNWFRNHEKKNADEILRIVTNCCFLTSEQVIEQSKLRHEKKD